MSGKKLVMWVAFALIAAGAFWLSDYDAEQKEARQDLANRVVSLQDKVGIQTIELSGTVVPKPVTIVRDEAAHAWRITAPVKYLADNLVVGRMIDDLTAARVTRRLEKPGDLAQFGLKPPNLRVTFQTKGGETATVLLGELSPTKEHVYAAPPDGKQVWFLPPTVRAAVNRTLFELRDKALVDFVIMNATGLTLEKGGQAVTLEKVAVEGSAQKEPRWRFADGGAADVEAVEDLMYRIHGLRTEDFIDDGIDPAKMGLDRPVMKIVLRLTGEKETGVVIGGMVPGRSERYARRLGGGPVMAVDVKKLGPIGQVDRFALTARWVRRFDRRDVKSLKVTRGDQTVAFERTDGVWRRSQPPGDDKTGEPGALLAWDLANLKWQRLLPAGKNYGLDKPQAVVEVVLEPAAGGQAGKSGQFRLIVGTMPDGDGLVPIKASGDERVFGVDAKFLKSLPVAGPKKDRKS